MTSRIHCPYCGEKKRNASHSIKRCVSCEKPLHACPECGSRDVGFIGVDLLGCYECDTEFLPPGTLRNKGKDTDSLEWVSHWDRLEEDELLEKVTEEEFTWITDFAIQIKPRLRRILTYDPGNYGHRGLSKDPKLSYLRNLRYSLHIGPLLELRRDFQKSKVKELPTAEWFTDNVVPKPRDIPYGISYPQGEEHLRWGNILREEFYRSFKLEKQTPSALR